MQLSNKPTQLPIPFANSGARTAIPTASQIGITAGAASLTDGFPPLTRTPISAGGVPPKGVEMNGILYELSAINQWANMGGGYPYDSTYATAIGGYPKGARVLRTDGIGYWLNTTDNNATDPEAGGSGWVPDLMPGSTPVTMTGSNVTLTPLQYGQPVIRITGLLTANLNLIFPAISSGKWTVINATTGAFTITAKTASGTGVTVSDVTDIVCDGTNILQVTSGITQAQADARYVGIGYMLVRDEKAQGTDGGGATAGSTVTRTLNTVSANTISGASLTSNQITLPAGTYRFYAAAPAFGVNAHKAYFYNVTDSNGTTGTAENGNLPSEADPVATVSNVRGRFTIASSKVFELRHYLGSTRATDGLGASVGAGGIEVYSQVEIIKES